MTFRYFSKYGKVLPLPEVLQPKILDERFFGERENYRFNDSLYMEAVRPYNEWLSKGIPVPDEHLKFFEVDRDESEFERQHQILLNGEWVNCSFFVWEKDLNDKRIVAIPKESKERVDSPIDFESLLQSATIYGRPLSTFLLLPDQVKILAEYLSNQTTQL